MNIVFGCAQFSNNYIYGQRKFSLSKINNFLTILKKNTRWKILKTIF